MFYIANTVLDFEQGRLTVTISAQQLIYNFKGIIIALYKFIKENHDKIFFSIIA
jgi:hypothetical protein